MSGLDVRTISDIERGRTIRPHRSTVDALARALDRDDLGYEVIRARRLTQARVPGALPAADGQVSGASQKGTRARLVEVFPVTIGRYADADLADSDTQAQVGRLIDSLAPFGGQHRPWKHPARGRGADAVQRRLREWTCPQPTAGSSVLYWAGHGWSDGSRVALAHAESPAVVGASGIDPLQLAEAIRARQAIVEPRGEVHDGGGWAMVIIEASHATQIADAVMAALHGPGAPGRLLVVAVAADGTGPTGRFPGILSNLLADTYRAEQRIRLRDLAAQLERLLGPRNVHQRAIGETALARVHPPAASWMSAPVETIRCLEDVLRDLSPDERGHFMVKAQGAENGELSWFFEGREAELAQLSTWLHKAGSGMLVVTGRAGSGKSALLGTLLVRSRPALRDALARRGLVAAPGPGPAEPPASVFDAVIHLSGLDLAQAIARIAAVAGLASPPSPRSSQPGVAVDLDFLAEGLRDRAKPFTVLADALDECVDAADVARSLLARLAALPGVRIVVGTRASTSEAPDVPAADENLLEALGSNRSIRSQVIRISRDRAAIQRYVTGRLRAARDYGVAGRAVPHMSEVSDENIDQVAAEVAAGEQEFLFARLAVYELIADPRLLTAGLTRSRNRLLQGTHQDLFGRAVHRLADHDDRYPILMRALSLARGAGLPEADGIWAVMADALAPGLSSGPVSDPSDAAAWASAISGLLSQAAAYITADTAAQPGPPTRAATVYRLAHRTFAEHFTRHSGPGQVGADCRRLAAIALLRTAQATAAGPGHLPGYLVNHLSGHVAEADLWDDLQSLPHVLDRIDPGALTADAIRTLLGRRPVPPPLAGLIGARDTLADANPADRPGLRQLATTIYSARQVIGEPVLGWGVAAAQAGRSTLHIGLSGHTSTVNMVLSLTLAGRVLLASCGDDGTIRLWDPLTATPVGIPMKGHTSSIDDICVLSSRDGRLLLAGAGEDGTIQLWDPATGLPAGPVITGHDGPVWSVCPVPALQPDQSPALASAGSDGTIRIWDPATGLPAGPVITGPVPVLAVHAVPGAGPAGTPVLASAGDDGTIRLWDPATGLLSGPAMTGHAGPVLDLCLIPSSAARQSPALASAGLDGTIRLWDPISGRPAGPVITGHAGPVWSMCVVPGAGPRQTPVLASAGFDGTIRLWDPASGRPAGPAITADAGGLLGVCLVAGGEPGRQSLLASAGSDGTVRLWEPACGEATGSVITARPVSVLKICSVPRPEQGSPPVLASAAEDGTVRLWDPATGQSAGPVITGHEGAVLDVCTVHRDDPGQPPRIASAGRDGTVRLWDPASGQPAGPVITAHAGPVRSLCEVPSLEPGRPLALASAGSDGTVRLWDPATGLPAGPVITADHTGGVMAVCVVPSGPDRPLVLATAGLDGTIRRWNPVSGQPAGPVIGGHSGPVWSLCVLRGAGAGQSPILASAGEDGTVRLWDTGSGRPAGRVLTGHDGGVLAVCAGPGAGPGQPELLVSAGSDGTVRLWDVAAGGPAGPVITATGPVRTVCAVPSGEPGTSATLASAGLDGAVQVWQATTGRALGEPLISSTQAVRALAACTKAIGDCVSLHQDGTIRTWTGATARQAAVISSPDVSAITTLVEADHPCLLSGDIYGRLHLTDPCTGRGPGPPLQLDHPAVLALCPLPRRLGVTPVAVAAGSGTITIVTVSVDGRLERGPQLRGPVGPIRALCQIVGPRGPQLAAAGSDGVIWLWDLTAIDLDPPDPDLPPSPAIAMLTGHCGRIWSLAAVPCPPGQRTAVLASAGADNTVRLWDPATGSAVGQPLTGHSDQVRAVIAVRCRDGRVALVSGGHDGTVRLWDLANRAQHAVAPLGVPVHALLQPDPDPASAERTGGGATITVGLRTGILALDLHRDLFCPASPPKEYS